MRLTALSIMVLAATMSMQAQSVTAAEPATALPVPAVSPSPAKRPANASPAPSATPEPYTFPTAKTRFRRAANEIFGPTALAKSAFSAGFFTWKNSPEEWGPTWRGAAKRFGSGVAKTFIRSSISYGLEEGFQLDSHFYKSRDRSVGAKLRNALISPVTARNRDGKRVFGFPRVIATYTAGVVAAEWWFPARYSWRDGLRSGTISLGMSAGFNLIKEFLRK